MISEQKQNPVYLAKEKIINNSFTAFYCISAVLIALSASRVIDTGWKWIYGIHLIAILGLSLIPMSISLMPLPFSFTQYLISLTDYSFSLQ